MRLYCPRITIMYLIVLRNHAIAPDGDQREFVRDSLEEAIHDTIITVLQNPKSSGSVSDMKFMKKMEDHEKSKVFSCYNSGSNGVFYTNYRVSDWHAIMGWINAEDEDIENFVHEQVVNAENLVAA